jgi:tetratricopeptide (TPR) repeat protein
MLAHHYLSALELGRALGHDVGALIERTRIVTREAGDRAVALNAFAAAVRFYSHALELSLPDDPEHAELLFRFGSALHVAADERAEQVLEEASRELIAAGRPERAAEAHGLLSVHWWYRGKRDRSRQHLDHARALLGAGQSEARARVLALVARAYAVADEDEAAIEAGREALAIAERLGLDEIRVHALASIGTARFNLGDAEGVADVERSIEIALNANNPEAAKGYSNLGYRALLAGDIQRGRELVEEGGRVAERFGDRHVLRFQLGLQPQYHFYAGRWQDALLKADAFVAECEAGAPHYLESTARWPRALIRLAQGDAEGAAADALRAEELGRERSDPQQLLPALSVRMRVEFELGHIERSAGLADELLGRQATLAIPPPGVELAWTTRGLASADAVRDWIAAVTHESLWSDAAVAILDGEFERAAELFVQIGSVPDEARARLRAAETLVADGRRAEADSQLDKALSFYRSVGATRYVRAGEALFAVSA